MSTTEITKTAKTAHWSPWTPKINEKAMLVGIFTDPVVCTVLDKAPLPGFYRIAFPNHDYLSEIRHVHVRNLDPYIEDERTGLPWPKLQVDDVVEVTVKARVRITYSESDRPDKNVVVVVPASSYSFYGQDSIDVNVRRVDRRVSDRGRVSRGSSPATSVDSKR